MYMNNMTRRETERVENVQVERVSEMVWQFLSIHSMFTCTDSRLCLTPRAANTNKSLCVSVRLRNCKYLVRITYQQQKNQKQPKHVLNENTLFTNSKHTVLETQPFFLTCIFNILVHNLLKSVRRLRLGKVRKKWSINIPLPSIAIKPDNNSTNNVSTYSHLLKPIFQFIGVRGLQNRQVL